MQLLSSHGTQRPLVCSCRTQFVSFSGLHRSDDKLMHPDFNLVVTSDEDVGSDPSICVEGSDRIKPDTNKLYAPTPHYRRRSESAQRSRSHERFNSESPSFTAGKLAAYAFNLMVTFPENAASSDKKTLKGYSSDVPHNDLDSELSAPSDLSKDLRPGQVKSAPSTPLSERIPLRNLPRNDVFVAPGASHPPHHIATPTHRNLAYRHTPLSPPPDCQSYRPMKLKTASFSKTNRDAIKNLSISTPAMSPSGSPRHSDSDAPPHVSKTNKKFRKKFSKILSTEQVLKSYACAIVSDILLQGTLYITENYFAFYSNILGFINRTVIPIIDVANIQKEKTARFIPNAVGLQTYDGKTYVFSSLISRDATYKFMMHIWKKSRLPSDGIHDDIAIFDDDKVESGSNSSCYSNGDAESFVDGIDGVVNESSESSQMVTVRSRPPSMMGSNSHGGTKCNSSPDHSPTEGFGVLEPPICSKDSDPLRNSYSTRSTSDYDASIPATKSIVVTDASSNPSYSSQLPKWQQLLQSKLIKSVIQVIAAPFNAVREGLHEITLLPRTSLLLIASSLLVFLLLASAAFMIYKVEILSQQMSYGANDEYSSGLYEEVLKMQQKLHTATADEIEKTLNLQIKQLATVRQSLDALVFLFNKDPSRSSTQLGET